MTYVFILRFGTLDKLNFVYEQLKKKSSSFTLRKFINPANIRCRFTLIIECREQDIVEVIQNYLSGFYSDDVEISLLHGHESEIDNMKSF